MSRTVVKPQSSAKPSMRTACAVRYEGPSASTLDMFTSLAYACMCASMRPGISVRPPTSTTRALFDRMGLSETSRIRLPSTRTLMPSGHLSLLPSKMRALRNSRLDMGILWPPGAAAAKGITTALLLRGRLHLIRGRLHLLRRRLRVLRRRIVLRIDVHDVERTHGAELHYRRPFRPGVVVRFRRQVMETAGVHLVAGFHIHLVALAEMERARDHREVLVGRVVMRRDLVVCGNLKARDERSPLAGMAGEHGELGSFRQQGRRVAPLRLLCVH